MAHALGYLIRAGVPRVVVRMAGWRTVFLLIAVIFGAMWVPSGRAQGAAAVQAVHFTVFSPKPIADVGYAPKPGAAPQKIAFAPTARSSRYEYRGAMPVRFVDMNSSAVVAEALIPAGVHDALLLFAPADVSATPPSAKGGAAAVRYQISVLDDSAARHGPGGLAIINLSGLALNGTVNNEKVSLKPGLNPALTVGKSAKVTLSTTFKGRTYQSYAGTATLGRNERALLILFPPFYAGSLEVQSRMLTDQPPPAASKVGR